MGESDETAGKGSWTTWIRVVSLPFVVALGWLLISRDSFWMDESGPAFKALMPDLRTWWEMTKRIGGSDIQMPFYMASLWVWAKEFRDTELAFRSINLFWLVLMVVPFRRYRWWPLVVLVSPFVVVYLGELRPYLMQMAGAAWAASGISKQWKPSREGAGYVGLQELMAGCLILCLASLTSAIWAMGAVAALILLRPEWWRKGGFWLRVVPWGLVAGVAAGYYAYTLTQGHRAATAGEGGILSIGFGIYEMLGLAGLGPGRAELRESPASVVRHGWKLLPALAILGAAWLWVVWPWWKGQSWRVKVAMAMLLGMPVIAIAGIGWVYEFRVVGRHLSPGVVALLAPIAALAEQAMGGRRGAIVLSLGVLSAWIGSLIPLRWGEAHRKDDYRWACERAMNLFQERKVIWWQADMNGMRYYAFRRWGGIGVQAVQKFESEPPTTYSEVDYLFINRPELRFRGMDYRKKLEAEKFELIEVRPGFELWKSQFVFE